MKVNTYGGTRERTVTCRAMELCQGFQHLNHSLMIYFGSFLFFYRHCFRRVLIPLLAEEFGERVIFNKMAVCTKENSE